MKKEHEVKLDRTEVSMLKWRKEKKRRNCRTVRTETSQSGYQKNKLR